jgi:hypothetical protein
MGRRVRKVLRVILILVPVVLVPLALVPTIRLAARRPRCTPMRRR